MLNTTKIFISKLLTKNAATIMTLININNKQTTAKYNSSLSNFVIGQSSVLGIRPKNMFFDSNIMTVKLTFSRKSLFYSPKRYMYTLTRIRNLLYRGNINKNVNPMCESPNRIINRSHTNWTGQTRIETPKKDIKPPLMPIDPETKLEIMRAYDASGENHILLINGNFKHEHYYMVCGSFTTSSTFYENVPPEMVAGFTLRGDVKPQFLHTYKTPRLIAKCFVILDEEVTASLHCPEYASYLDDLPY